VVERSSEPATLLQTAEISILFVFVALTNDSLFKKTMVISVIVQSYQS
jgi:hypothetical protein